MSNLPTISNKEVINNIDKNHNNKKNTPQTSLSLSEMEII